MAVKTKIVPFTVPVDAVSAKTILEKNPKRVGFVINFTAGVTLWISSEADAAVDTGIRPPTSFPLEVFESKHGDGVQNRITGILTSSTGNVFGWEVVRE
jgi:hypothetical protein